LESDKTDSIYGKYPLSHRHNVHQVPYAFLLCSPYNYKDKGADRVWVRGPKGASGLAKRQCTLQICVTAGGAHCRLAIIFRGKGLRISKEEKRAWHPNVDVYWQKCAWVNERVCYEWVKGTFKDSVKNVPGEHLLFLDNLSAHKTNSFEEELDKLKVKRIMFPPNNTDHLQPVDAHIGRFIKNKMSELQDAWLEYDDHLLKWEDHLSASERRILIT